MLHTADGACIALGSGGSNRIRSAILQVVCALVDGGLPLAEAIQRPRIHYENGTLNSEGGTDAATRTELQTHCENVACWPERNLFFGGVHAVARSGSEFTCYGDPRRGGVAVTV
jgi:gamma-glutamyltranspeptidase/glutathione hydrolase